MILCNVTPLGPLGQFQVAFLEESFYIFKSLLLPLFD